MREYAVVLLTAGLVTYLATPVVRLAAVRLRMMAAPRERDVHVIPTPRGGGVAMYLGVAAAVLVATRLPALQRTFEDSQTAAVLVAGGLICALGVLDDKFGLDALTKLTGQIAAAGVMVLLGVQLLYVFLPVADIGTLSLGPDIGVPLTLLLTVLTVNALNFIDGLDGLAAGVSGSMLVGLMLSAAAVSATGQADPQTFDSAASLLPLALPLLVPIAVLSIPFIDLVMAVVRRSLRGRSPFSPDKMHLHHRLLAIGHSHRRAVLVMYFWAALLSFGAVGLSITGGRVELLVGIAVLLVLGVVVVLSPRARRAAREARAAELEAQRRRSRADHPTARALRATAPAGSGRPADPAGTPSPSPQGV